MCFEKRENFSVEISDVSAKVKFTRNAEITCDDLFISKTVVVDCLQFTKDYLISKKEGEKFIVVDSILNNIVIGYVNYNDKKEMELLIIFISNDIHVIDKNDKRDIKRI